MLPLLKQITDYSSNADTKFLLKNYVNTLERLILSENFEGFSERTKLFYKYQKQIDDVRKAFDHDRQLLLRSLEAEIKRQSWWKDNVWDLERTGGSVSIWKNSGYNDKDGIYILIEASTEEPMYSMFIFGEPAQFSMKVGQILEKNIDKKFSGKISNGFSKSFATGVSRFIKKEVHLSLAEKNQPQELIKNCNELISAFEKSIDSSIAELGKNDH